MVLGWGRWATCSTNTWFSFLFLLVLVVLLPNTEMTCRVHLKVLVPAGCQSLCGSFTSFLRQPQSFLLYKLLSKANPLKLSFMFARISSYTIYFSLLFLFRITHWPRHVLLTSFETSVRINMHSHIRDFLLRILENLTNLLIFLTFSSLTVSSYFNIFILIW